MGSSPFDALEVWGENDPRIAEKDLLNECIPGDVEVMKDAPHPAYMKDSEYFNKLVANFLKNLKTWKKIEFTNERSECSELKKKRINVNNSSEGEKEGIFYSRTNDYSI